VVAELQNQQQEQQGQQHMANMLHGGYSLVKQRVTAVFRAQIDLMLSDKAHSAPHNASCGFSPRLQPL
jgi:hypothetical protein